MFLYRGDTSLFAICPLKFFFRYTLTIYSIQILQFQSGALVPVKSVEKNILNFVLEKKILKFKRLS